MATALPIVRHPPCARPAIHLLWGCAAVVLLGWATGAYPFSESSFAFTTPVTALGFLLIAASLLFEPHNRTAATTSAMVVLVFAAGGAAVSTAAANALSHLPTMGTSLPAAGVLFVSASALLIRQIPWRQFCMGDLCGALLLVSGITFLLGHLFGAPFSASSQGYLSVGLPTAVMTFLSGFLLIATAPGGNIARLFIDPGSAGLLLRRLVVPARLLLPAAAVDHPYMHRSMTLGEDRFIDEHRLLESIIDSSSEPIVVKDREGRYQLVNQAAADAMRRPIAELVGRKDHDLLSADVADLIVAVDTEVMARDIPKSIERTIETSTGVRTFISAKTALHDRNGDIVGVVSIAHDITDRKRYEEELAQLSTHDKLTGLPNHTLLIDRLKQSIALAERESESIVVVCFDLDDFHLVNEEISYEAGNTLLQAIAERIAQCVREGDTVARVYGDEFVVLLPGARDAVWITEFMSRVLSAIREPWCYEGEECRVTASGGISSYPTDGHNAEELLGHARRSLEKAKSLGKNRIAFNVLAPGGARNPRRLDRQRELQRAIEHNEFVLHYQPKIELRSGRIIGAEALIRWQHPERGLVSPAEFIPLAEESGLVVPIGEWALAHACHSLSNWRRDAIDCPPVAVNLSIRQLQDRDVHQRLVDIMRASGTPASSVDFEITETAILRDSAITIQNLRALAEEGSGIALDDFGTGYSSLSLLRMFPISSLKIDRSFVSDLITDAEAATITRTVIGMARSLNLDVVAEGVETAEQLRFLSHHGCHQMQGYLFSKPLPEPEFKAMLALGTEMTLAQYGLENARTLLLLDDEEPILLALKRMLRREGYRILTATAGAEALALLANNDVQYRT